MNFKIFETATELPDVLLYIDQTDDFQDCVIIHAIGDTTTEAEQIVWEKIVFPDRQMCRNFIRDYSVDSANSFCIEHDLLYQNEKLQIAE